MKLLLPLLVLFSSFASAQPKIVISTHRLFPKADKIGAFEMALSNHERGFHNDNRRWRVYQILTGPDAGGYHIEEGPMSWADFGSPGYNSMEA